MKSYSDICFEREQLEFAEAAWLRAKGWNHTSTTPGCLWLWVRNLTWYTLELPRKPSGRFTRVKHQHLVMVDRETAISIQRTLDDDAATPKGGADHG